MRRSVDHIMCRIGTHAARSLHDAGEALTLMRCNSLDHVSTQSLQAGTLRISAPLNVAIDESSAPNHRLISCVPTINTHPKTTICSDSHCY